MRNNREYQICKDIAQYMRLQYPDVIYRFDMAGLNLSMAQAGMNKAIQCGKGWPDLFIAKPCKGYIGMFLEIKKEGTDIFKKRANGYGYFDYINQHIKDQEDMLYKLEQESYFACFVIGFDQAKKEIDNYLKT